jgi:hypothetical protein
MMKLDLLSAALISAALLTTPAMARKSQVTPERFAANANAPIPTGALSAPGSACCRTRAKVSPGADQDVWGRWGAYYGPMVHAP